MRYTPLGRTLIAVWALVLPQAACILGGLIHYAERVSSKCMVGNIYHILLQIHHFILNLVSFPRRGISCIWQRTTHSSHHTTGRSVQLGSQWLWPARTRGDHSLELIPLLDQQLRTPSHRDLLWRVPLSGYLEYRLCEILILLWPLSFASCQISCTHSVYLNA